jgi:drug/metabolite transporter (DMT)-like permease
VPIQQRPTWRAYAALVVAVAGITWSAIFVRWAGVPGTASALYRVVIAGAILVPWWLLRGRGGSASARRRFSTRQGLVAVAGGVFFALDLALWNSSVLRTQAAVASVLGNNTPFFVGMMSWLVFHRRPRASFWIGLGLALAGCLMIIGADLRRGGGGTGNLTGDVMALVASVFFAAYLVTTERIRPKMDTLTFSTLAIAGSIATLFVLGLALRIPLSGYPPRAWLAIAGLGIISQLVAYFALVYALGHLPATITSVGLLAQVPSTALLAMLLLGEPLTALQLLGGAIVLAGIYVVNRGEGS